MNGLTSNQHTQVRPTVHMLTRHPGGSTNIRATLQNPNPYPGSWLPFSPAPNRSGTPTTSTMSREVAEVLENLERRHPTRNSQVNQTTTVEVPTITLSDSDSEPANCRASTVPTVPTDSPISYRVSSPSKSTGYDKEQATKSVNQSPSQPDDNDSGDDSTCELLKELDFDEEDDSIFVHKKTQ